MSMSPSNDGFLLFDARLNLIASNVPALQILCFPSEASRMKQPKVFLADRVRIALLDHKHRDGTAFVKEFTSGKRRYICKVSPVECGEHYSVRPAFIVLLERDTANSHSTLAEISAQWILIVEGADSGVERNPSNRGWGFLRE